MEGRETARMRKYGESKTTRIMMPTVPHITSSLGLRKFQTDGFLLTRVYTNYCCGKHNQYRLRTVRTPLHLKHFIYSTSSLPVNSFSVTVSVYPYWLDIVDLCHTDSLTGAIWLPWSGTSTQQGKLNCSSYWCQMTCMYTCKENYVT